MNLIPTPVSQGQSFGNKLLGFFLKPGSIVMVLLRPIQEIKQNFVAKSHDKESKFLKRDKPLKLKTSKVITIVAV